MDENFFRRVIDSLEDYAVFTTDTQGRISSWNGAAERLLGYAEQEIIGEAASVIFTEDDRKAGIPRQEMQVAAEQDRALDERFHQRKDGSTFWASGLLFPLKDESGALRGFTKILRDRSKARETQLQLEESEQRLKVLSEELAATNEELQAANEELQTSNEDLEKVNERLTRTNEELDQYVYKVSHDIRSPVASILGLVGFIQLEPLSKPVSEYLSLIENRINRLDEFIRSVLSHSRSLNTQLSSVPIDFNQLINQCLEELQYYPEGDQLRVDRQVPPPGSFWGDELRLGILFKNLVSNAIKYQKRQGDSFLAIRVEVTETEAILMFTDNGQGIARQFQPKIFGMFFRATEIADGSGLGLYIVRQAVERMRGTITLKSQEGKGTSFTVRLPNHKPAL